MKLLEFWKGVVLARSFNGVNWQRFANVQDVEIEAFGPWSHVCFLLRSAVRLNHMSMMPAVVVVSHSLPLEIRFNMPWSRTCKSLKGEIPEAIFNVSRWHVHTDHIPDMIEKRCRQFEIEGHETHHYVFQQWLIVTRRLCYLESPENSHFKQDLVSEMRKVAQRELATGFTFWYTHRKRTVIMSSKFLNTSLSLKWLRTMMRLKRQPFVNGMSTTKSSFMDQVSVILRLYRSQLSWCQG